MFPRESVTEIRVSAPAPYENPAVMEELKLHKASQLLMGCPRLLCPSVQATEITKIKNGMYRQKRAFSRTFWWGLSVTSSGGFLI